MNERIALIGFMASGKSTVGQRLASLTGRPFVDLDQRIEAAAGRSIPEIFEQQGEAGFRELEARTLREVLDEAPCVLATGGGSVHDPVSRERLRRRARVVWLDLRFDSVRSRLSVEDPRQRPLVAGSREEELLALYRGRRRDYAAAAELRVEVDRRSAVQIARWVLDALERLPRRRGGGTA